MTRRSTHRPLLAAFLTALLSATLLVPPSGAAAAPTDQPGRRGPAGLTSASFAVFNGTYLRGHDMVGTAAGTFLAWATSDHRISTCLLHRGTTGCVGGVRSTDALGDPHDMELALDAAGRPTAVWTYDTPASVSGPMGARLAAATIAADGSVSPATVVADAPSFGELYSVTRGPDGRIWAVVLPRAGSTSLMVYPGLGAPVTVPTPYYPGDARVEFTGANDGVLVINRYGSISDPIAAAPLSGGAFGSFSPVAGTWNAHGFGLVRSVRGVEVVASRNSASYETVVARWTGSAFTRPRRTGQKECTATSHDLVTDLSGRIVDAFGGACGIGVANIATGDTSGVATWSAGATQHAGPQVATSMLGLGWVAWAIEGDAGAFDKLVVAPIALPATPATKSGSNPAGRVTLSGVEGCMPPSTVRVAMKARAKRGWRLMSKALTFDGKRASRINGAALSAGSRHVLKAKATFSRAGQRRAVTVTLRVRACKNG